MTGLLTLAPSTTGGASLNLANGTAPTSPVNGDTWAASGLIKYRSAGATVTVATLEGAQVFTGAVTAASFSGPLTGAVTGNASTATALATGRTLAITGDLTWTSPSFDGSGNVTAAGTLATVNANVGSFGGTDGFSISRVTVNGKGLVTAASQIAIPTMVGDSGSGGTKGLAPAATAGDAALKKTLHADGTFAGGFYDSGQITLVAGGQTGSLAHGLGASTKLNIQAYLVCTSGPSQGYNTGQEIQFGPPSGNTSTGIQLGNDFAGDIIYTVGSTAPQVINPSSKATNALTLVNWALIIRAWAP